MFVCTRGLAKEGQRSGKRCLHVCILLDAFSFKGYTLPLAFHPDTKFHYIIRVNDIQAPSFTLIRIGAGSFP